MPVLRFRHDRAGSAAGQQFSAGMVKLLAIKVDEMASSSSLFRKADRLSPAVSHDTI